MSFSANIQNFDDWYCIFNSSIEPRGEYIQLLPDLIKWVRLFYKNQIETIFDQENSEKLATLIIPSTITKFLNFADLHNNEVKNINDFLLKCSKFAFFSIKNNIKQSFPSIIKLFDNTCLYYEKNDFLHKLYDNVVQNFINQIQKYSDSFESLDDYEKNDHQDDLEIFHTLFLISHNILKAPKFKDFATNLVDKTLYYFYIFLKNVKNLRELNTNDLKDIFNFFYEDMKDIVTESCIFQLLNFLIRCMKSDYLDKQLFAAEQIVNMCDQPRLFENLLNYNSKEVNLIDLIISNNYHFKVMSILNKFLTQMANQKMLTIQHLIQLWEKSQNLHITERKSALELISKCFDFFDESELQEFIEYLYCKKEEFNDVYYLLSSAVLAIQHKENMKELSFDIVNHLLDDVSLQEAQDGIETICSTIVSSDIMKLISRKVILYICDNNLIDFALNITLKIIKNSNLADDIFTDNYITNLIHLIMVDDENSFDNRKAIFKILHVLYTSSSLKPNSDILKEIISTKKDNIVWDFLRQLLVANNIVKKDQSEPIEEAVKSQDLQLATINFTNFLIAFIYFMNKSSFLNVKFKDDTISIQSFHLDTIELTYFDLLFDLYLECEDIQVSNEAKDFILKIYTSCSRISSSTKDIQQRVYKLIDNYDELKKLKILTLLYEYLQISETNINPEDFGMPSHKFSKKFIKMTIIDSDGNKVLIHVNPKNDVHVLKSRITVIAKSKADFISIPQLDYEKEDKLIENLNLHPSNEIKWHFKSSMRTRQIFDQPPSCELHKTHFSDCLLEILDQQCSEEASKIVWKLLKYLPTNEKAASALDDFDSFFKELKQSKNAMKFRYFLQIFLQKYGSDNEEEIKLDQKDEYLKNFVELFIDKKYPKKELLQIFIQIFKYGDLFDHADMIIPELLWCICRDNHLSKLVNKIFSGFLEINPTRTSEILMINSLNLGETIHSLEENDWQIFLNLLSNSENLEDVTDLCIDELSNESENIKFFLKLSTEIIPKLKIKKMKVEEEEENDDNVLKFIKLFSICIDFFNDDKNINDVLNLLCVLIQGYPELLQKNKNDDMIQIPIEKIISIAFDDPPDELQTVIFKILGEIIKYSKFNDDLLLIRNEIDQIISIPVDRWNYDPSMFRKVEPYAGLRNLGATCFANSVIQQLYHLFPIRFLLLMHNFEEKNEYLHLQHLFQLMMFTERSFCNPADFFSNWHGWYEGTLINTREQQDSIEFLILVIDNNQKNTSNCFPTEINKLFKGEMKNRLKGVNDPFSNKSTEVFYSLSLSITGFKNMNESLNEFNQIETIYDYCLDNPKRKITVHKSLRISKPPAILVIQLKRFEIDYSDFTRKKINDKFEFPDELDISSICDFEEEDEYVITKKDCLYELHGVIVHTGNANGGHYFSIININQQWFMFNDSEVSKINRETMEKTCYGDNSEKTSAYLLFYVRKDFEETFDVDGHKNILLSFDENPELTNILKEERFSEEIKKDNILFKRTQSLFKIPVINFIMNFNDFEINLKYFINVLCHSTHADKTTQFQENLNRIIDDQQKEVDFVNYLMEHFDEVFNNYLNCYDLNIMKDFNKVVIHCLRNIIIAKEEKNRSLPFVLLDKIYEIVSNHINAFRQIPLILSIIEFCISMDPEISYKKEFGFNWIEKITQLINNIYGVQRTSQFLSNSDYSLLFKSLIDIIKVIPKKSIDCSFLFAHSQNILKSNSNIKDYIDLLLTCSKTQNVEINEIFGMLSSTNNSKQIITSYFTDLVCTCNNYEEIISDIRKYIYTSQEDNNDVIIINDNKYEGTRLERCVQILHRFSNEIESNSIFISKFLTFSPFIVHDFITNIDEFVRTQCEDLYYKIFRSYDKMPSNLSYYKPTRPINKIISISPYLKDTSKIYDNAMEPFLTNIENYFDQLDNLLTYYPIEQNNKTRNNKLYGYNNEISYSVSASNSRSEEKEFRLLSILRIYRWIVCSLPKEWKNHSFYPINPDSFTLERADYIIGLIRRFVNVNYHPDYNIRQLLLLLGEFPVEILQNNLFKAFKFIFEQYDDCDFTTQSLQIEFEPFVHIIDHYKDEEELQNDIISIFIHDVFIQKILQAFNRSPTSSLLTELLPILKEYKKKHPEIIESNESLCKLISDLSLKNSVSVKTHYSMSKSGSLIQQEVNRHSLNKREDNSSSMDDFDDFDSDEINRFIHCSIQFLLNENINKDVKKRIDQFIKYVKPEEQFDEDLFKINEDELKRAIETIQGIDTNLNYIFRLVRWGTWFSKLLQDYAKKLILDILRIRSNSNYDVLILETARFAAAFDFDQKSGSLLNNHYSRIEMNHSPSIGHFGSQRNKKMIAFLESLLYELDNSEDDDIEWMSDFAKNLILKEHNNTQEKQLRKKLIHKLSNDTILKIFFDLEKDFLDSNCQDGYLAKSMAFIINELDPELIEIIKSKTKLTESNISSLNQNLKRSFMDMIFSDDT